MSLSVITFVCACAAAAALLVLNRSRAGRPGPAYGISGLLCAMTVVLVWQELIVEPEAAEPYSSALSAGYLEFTPQRPAAVGSRRATAGSLPSVPAMIENLELRLETDPTDAKGWSLLARSYAYVGNDSALETAIANAVRLGVEEDSLRLQVNAVQRSR